MHFVVGFVRQIWNETRVCNNYHVNCAHADEHPPHSLEVELPFLEIVRSCLALFHERLLKHSTMATLDFEEIIDHICK